MEDCRLTEESTGYTDERVTTLRKPSLISAVTHIERAELYIQQNVSCGLLQDVS